MPTLSVSEIADMFPGAIIKGCPSLEIHGLAPIQLAQPGEATFLGNSKYRKWVTRTRASLVILPPDFDGEPPENTAWLIVESPNQAFAQLALRFAPPPRQLPKGIHPSAIVAESAQIGQNVAIGPCAVIEDDVSIGDNTIIDAGVFIAQGVTIGNDCHIHANVSIREYCRIGNRVIIHNNSVIGSDGFGYEPDIKQHRKIPQVGIVQIDDDVEIGACTTIDRARFSKTWIQRDVKIDNLCQIAHNVIIGEGSFLMAQVGIAGSTTIGKYVAFFGQSGAPGHIEVGDFAKVMGRAALIGDVEPSAEMAGYPAVNRQEFFRNYAYLRRLPQIHEKVKQLQAQVEQLKAQLEQQNNHLPLDESEDE
ncbi:MAG: UDP-3-O-(3-hydroxymyristoyl)glucosamine N-acyltransferase [Lentisphaerae bacterium]|nr:MAG: UDP-3-O-(3-hydroxymyristoyl)glucosamine N-acyltransferase [Lentisphaerota bacterium]